MCRRITAFDSGFQKVKLNLLGNNFVFLQIVKGIKAELQSLAKKRLTFISEEYIPEKLEKRDFLD